MYDYLFPYLVIETLEHIIMVNDVAIVDDELIVEYIGNESARKDFTTYVVGIMEKVTPIITKEINSISIGFSVKLTDACSRRSSGEIGLANFSRVTWEKINWKNFSNHNVSEAADSFWLNPPLNK